MEQLLAQLQAEFEQVEKELIERVNLNVIEGTIEEEPLEPLEMPLDEPEITIDIDQELSLLQSLKSRHILAFEEEEMIQPIEEEPLDAVSEPIIEEAHYLRYQRLTTELKECQQCLERKEKEFSELNGAFLNIMTQKETCIESLQSIQLQIPILETELSETQSWIQFEYAPLVKMELMACQSALNRYQSFMNALIETETKYRDQASKLQKDLVGLGKQEKRLKQDSSLVQGQIQQLTHQIQQEEHDLHFIQSKIQFTNEEIERYEQYIQSEQLRIKQEEIAAKEREERIQIGLKRLQKWICAFKIQKMWKTFQLKLESERLVRTREAQERFMAFCDEKLSFGTSISLMSREQAAIKIQHWWKLYKPRHSLTSQQAVETRESTVNTFYLQQFQMLLQEEHDKYIEKEENLEQNVQNSITASSEEMDIPEESKPIEYLVDEGSDYEELQEEDLIDWIDQLALEPTPEEIPKTPMPIKRTDTDIQLTSILPEKEEKKPEIVIEPVEPPKIVKAPPKIFEDPLLKLRKLREKRKESIKESKTVYHWDVQQVNVDIGNSSKTPLPQDNPFPQQRPGTVDSDISLSSLDSLTPRRKAKFIPWDQQDALLKKRLNLPIIIDSQRNSPIFQKKPRASLKLPPLPHFL